MDASLNLLHRLELDLISDQDPKTFVARLGIFIGVESYTYTEIKSHHLCDKLAN